MIRRMSIKTAQKTAKACTKILSEEIKPATRIYVEAQLWDCRRRIQVAWEGHFWDYELN